MPRIDDRSPVTPPAQSLGAVIVTSTTGSISIGLAFVIASRNAFLPAWTNAISFESTE